MSDPICVNVRLTNGEQYAVVYLPGQERQAQVAAAQWASKDEFAFSWWNCAVAGYVINKHSGKGVEQCHLSPSTILENSDVGCSAVAFSLTPTLAKTIMGFASALGLAKGTSPITDWWRSATARKPS